MQIAGRMDLSRSHATWMEGRVFALVLASGIAGVSITYPTVTVGNGTAGGWMAKFEVKRPQLTRQALSLDMSIAAKFQDAAGLMMGALSAGKVDLSSALTRAINSLAGVGATELTARAVTNDPSRTLPPAAHLAGSKPNPQSDSHVPGIGTRLPEQSIRQVNDEPVMPLDAVRIALPPASKAVAGAIPAETLGRIAAADRRSPAPVSTVDTQALAASASPQALPVSVPGMLSNPQPLNLLSAPKEVREFDLAKLGSTKSGPQALARSSSNALTSTAAKASPHPRNLPNIAKVPDRIVGDYIIHIAGLSLEGVPSGNLSVRIGMTGELSVRLAELLTPLQYQMAPDVFERLAGSSAASEYISFADLRAAGFDVRYDASKDRLMVSAQF